MSKPTGKALVPALRFPEFRDAGEWEEKILEEIGKFVGGGTPDTSVSEYWGGDIQWFTPSEIKQRNLSISKRTITEKGLRNSSAKLLPEGALLLSTRATIGDIGIANNPCTTNQGFQSLLVNSSNVNIFWYYWIIQHKNDLIRHSSGSTFLEIGKTEIKKIDALRPIKKEQQKIADCLSSIDNLITAHTQKHNALKAHKKGLMQQLFPAEGETVPKLRFPEFRDAGEWKKSKLGQLGELVSGLTYSPDDVRDNGLLVLRSSNVQDGEISLVDKVYVTPDIRGVNLSKPNDILICVRNGSKALIGKNALIPEDMPLCTHGAFMTVFRSQSANFVFQLFQSSAYQSQVDADLGATINSINSSHFIKYEFYVPYPLEQQKIADCLSSIDNLITAHTQKHNALKAHKKGLMQQLFPIVDEVNS